MLTYLLAATVDEQSSFAARAVARKELDDLIMNYGDSQPGFEIFEVFLKRLEQRIEYSREVLNKDIEGGRIPVAVVAIARDGKLIYFQAFGYRDKAEGVKMTTDTIFNIASIPRFDLTGSGSPSN